LSSALIYIFLGKLEINQRLVTVTGPLGVLKRSFKHASVEIFTKKEGDKNFVVVQSKKNK
jgi:ribosomal protein L6P/L9E